MFKKLKKAYQAIKSDTGVFYLYPNFKTLDDYIENNRRALKRLGKSEAEIAQKLARDREEWQERYK